VFPPSDSNSLEDSNDNLNGKAVPATLVDDQRGPEGLIPFAGGISAPNGSAWPYGYPMRPEILTAKPDIACLLHSLRRRKWLAIFLGLVLGGALGALGWYLSPTKFEAAAWLRVNLKEPSIMNNPGEGADFEAYRRNQIAAIKGNLVINHALDEKSVQDSPIIRRYSADPANWLSDNLVVDFPGNGEFMKISLRYEDPNGVSDLVNAVVTAFIKEVVVKERDDKLDRKVALERKLGDQKKLGLEKQRQLYELTQQIGTQDAQTAKVKYKMAVETLETLMRQRSDYQKLITELTFKKKMSELLMKNAENNNVPEEDIEAAISKDSRVQQAMVDLSNLQRELRDVEKVIKNKTDPAAVRVRDAINSVRQNLEEIKTEDRQQVIDQIRRNGTASSTNMQGLQLELDLLIAQYSQTASQIETQAENVQKLEKFNGDAEDLRAEIEQIQGIIREMSNDLSRRNIDLGSPPRVAVLEQAGKAVTVQPARQYIVTGIAGFFGFGLALFGVTFFEFLSRKLNASHELADGLGIRVMGDLPALRRRIGLRQRSRRAMHGLVAESINGIRATLVRNANAGSANVFLVTSAGESEGKTTVASQLAASLARGGRKTLLVDADLRHPGAHLVFGLTNEEGFCELLRGEVQVDDVVKPTPADNLWMVSAGRCDAAAVMALGKEAAAQVLGQLEARFEFIVIDTGPVLKVADALLLGAHVDGAILSVLRDVSRIHKVYEANERLKLAGVKVVGAVVNGIEDRGSFDRYHVETSAA
jgi:polysaccharide biosynthesis transport protein